MGSGRHVQDSNQPNQTMHEDDPVLGRHTPTHWTRQNFKKIGVVGAIITFALFVFTDYEILNERGQRHADIENQIRTVVCKIVSGLPDTFGEEIADLRRDYKCPPFDPSGKDAFRTLPAALPAHLHTVRSSASYSIAPGGKVVHRTNSATQAAKPIPTPHSTTPRPRASTSVSRPTSPATRTHTAKPTSAKPTPTQSATKSTPNILGPIVTPVTGLVCNLLGVCITLAP